MSQYDQNGRSAQFLRFALIGVGGFVVDALVLSAAIRFAGAGLYVGRLVSYLCAATFTWVMNRHFTFALRKGRNLTREWLTFLAANALGGAANYGVYASLVRSSAIAAEWPVIGVAAGSIAGLAINFTLSRHLVFRGSGSQP